MTVFSLLALLSPALFVIGYANVSSGRWASASLKFHAVNFAGAALILLSLTEQWNLPVCILEGCWCAISLIGIVRAVR